VTLMVIRKFSEDGHAKRTGRFLGPPLKKVKNPLVEDRRKASVGNSQEFFLHFRFFELCKRINVKIFLIFGVNYNISNYYAIVFPILYKAEDIILKNTIPILSTEEKC
jgi:hypothetical protein